MKMSESDRQKIVDTISSPGWELLKTIVWKDKRDAFSEACRTVKEDHRYWQGYAAGFDFSVAVAEGSGKTEEEYGNLQFGIDETALFARKTNPAGY